MIDSSKLDPSAEPGLAQYDSDELVTRAIRAYQRECHRTGEVYDQPGAGDSGVVELDGRFYLQLANGYRTLRVYRIANWNTPREQLRMMRRPPAYFTQEH